MIESFHKLRQKPEYVKKRIAAIATLAIFSIIFGTWWFSWNSPTTENSVSISDVVSPLGVVANLFQSAKDHISTIGEELKGQVKYNSSGTAAKYETASVGQAQSPGTGDIVYPDQIFPSDARPQPVNN